MSVTSIKDSPLRRGIKRSSNSERSQRAVAQKIAGTAHPLAICAQLAAKSRRTNSKGEPVTAQALYQGAKNFAFQNPDEFMEFVKANRAAEKSQSKSA